ncbi:Gfo/Idh/MocA family protein [Qingshengfaniella alkalisoli]|uniref:Gfo/Idh/MocA family oxidoreductase n=1 Tax=Qingshengfaniella alkalisoli TaxID=2599296 RepID=A0A5B8J7T1_9RHOB|nr:Gfo/Idh/MocA family oxidoreductase [Qingshengfaniella alkalisoli]QDY70537.1 Gfo/Idh/MocA family oxidoreductase [Qingshengfaniella alkalisoli]
MPPLRIAVVGAGWVTEHHLAAYRELGDSVVVEAIADPDPITCSKRARRWGIPRCFSSDAEMLSVMDLDAVDVANPRQHHAASVRLAADHGLPVLCQKPLAPTWSEARDLVDNLPAGARLMVHENWRYRPHYGVIRDWVQQGRIGKLRQVLLLARTSGMIPDGSGLLPALQRQPMLAGLDRMLLMEVLIHHIDALRSVIGEMEFLAAVVGRDAEVLKGEDRATLLFKSGQAAVTLLGDFMTWGAPTALLDDLSLQGTQGAIRLSGDQLELRTGRDTTERHSIDLAADYKASYRDTIARFVRAVRDTDDAFFHAQVEDNLRSLELIERAYALSEFHSPPHPAG